jgi:hypothetical protein
MRRTLTCAPSRSLTAASASEQGHLKLPLRQSPLCPPGLPQLSGHRLGLFCRVVLSKGVRSSCCSEPSDGLIDTDPSWYSAGLAQSSSEMISGRFEMAAQVVSHMTPNQNSKLKSSVSSFVGMARGRAAPGMDAGAGS